MDDHIANEARSDALPSGFLREPDGLFRFVCENGHGLILADFASQTCSIFEFSSAEPTLRRGNGRRTVAWLRQHFNMIDVVDPGEPGTESRLFWERMEAEGLIDGLFDEECRQI